MPELPEVARTAMNLNILIAGKNLTNIIVHSEDIQDKEIHKGWMN